MKIPTSNEQQPLSDQQGLVISYFGNSVAVESKDGQVFQCHLRRNQDLPVVGDMVFFMRETGETGVILGIAPRRSLLSRGDGHRSAKPIAANIDVVVIVMSPPPIFAEYLVDRYLIAAELLSLQAIIVLNKVDLVSTATQDAVFARLAPYRQLDYPVVLSSTLTPDGLQDLSAQLSSKTAVLVGPSGVGKSSIIAKLGQRDSIRVGEVSPKGGGKHTTTATRLYHLPEGGQLIDSPGVREFNLWKVSQQDVLQGFKEFHPLLAACKFRDCRHLVEPGCAVQAALADGKISQERFASYQKLMKETSSSR